MFHLFYTGYCQMVRDIGQIYLHDLQIILDMWKEFYIWINNNVNMDIQFSPEYIICGNDYIVATR